MADLIIRLPIGNPLTPPLITLKDMGDGTYAPKISGQVSIDGNSSTSGGGKKGGRVTTTDAAADHGKVQIVTAGSSGSASDRLVGDGTGYLAYESKRIASNVATDGTVAQVVTALIAAGLMASS